MVERWTRDALGWVKWPDGEWVRFSDYADLERHLADMRTERDRQYDENVSLIAKNASIEAEQGPALLIGRGNIIDGGGLYVFGQPLNNTRITVRPLAEQGQAQGEWQSWKGGPCPVLKGTSGAVLTEDGEIVPSDDISGFGWSHGPDGPAPGRKIVAYRATTGDQLLERTRTKLIAAEAERDRLAAALEEIAQGCVGRVDCDHLACRVARAALDTAKGAKR